MSNPIIYNSSQYKNIICAYNKALYAASPEALRQEISEGMKISCSLTDEELNNEEKYEWTLDSALPRTKWTVDQIISVIADPWFSWNISGGNCSLNPIFLDDIFEDNSPPSAFACNPVNNTNGFTNDQQTLIKAIGAINHYLFARTYYIDRCYGTQQYLNFYYSGSEVDFINDHSLDFLDYVDDTGMIKGDKLLDAWRDNNFRSAIDVLSFIKPLAGLFCEDFWNWTNPNIYWWTEPATWNSSWNDNLTIADSWYDGSGNTSAINESKLITPFNSAVFPGYRISVNDLYFGLNNTESASLALLFSNNLLKGPTQIGTIPEQYDDTCIIDSGFEYPPVFPEPETTSIIPQSLNIIKDISIVDYTLQSISDNVDVFRVISSNTSTLLLLESCNIAGELMAPIAQLEPDIVPALPELPCSDEIEVVTDIFIDNMNLRVTKTRVKVVCILDPVNVNSVITTTTSCDESTINAVMSDDWNVTGCDGSVYNDPEWVFPKNMISVPYVTDVYIDENGSLVQKKSNIKIINRNNADIVKAFAVTFNCDGEPPALPPPDPELPATLLFDKSSWSNVAEPWKTYLDSAADRWGLYLKLDDATVTTMRRLYKGWNGIKLSNISFENKPKAFIVAGCWTDQYLNLNNGKINVLTFKLNINSGRIDILPNTWIDILTHELGHALGIGSWTNIDTVNSTMNGIIYSNTLNAYNSIIDNAIPNNNIIPTEKEGVPGANKDVHFEQTTRTINGIEYPGLTNELMTTPSRATMILSQLSIKNAVDIGYIEKNPGASEGNPTLDN